MKILIYRGKHEDEYFDISTDELRRGAYRHLFDQLGGAGYYDCSDPESKELALFNRATEGDDVALIQFMKLRSRYAYEGIEEQEIPQYKAHLKEE